MRPSYRTVIALVLTVACAPVRADADALDGRWAGTLDVGGTAERLTVDFVRADGSTRGVLNVPHDRVLGKPLHDLRIAGGRVAFNVPVTDGRVRFELRAAGRELRGFVTSPGGRLPIVLARTGPVPRRPYAEREVRFTSGAVALSGTLILPPGPGPFPAVVFVHGSSTPDRHDYLFFADLFARHAIAAFVYDKRDVGGDLGGASRVSLEELADDALAAVRAIRAQPRIAARKVGLWGHSQGGWVAPLAASRSRDVAFVIATSAPGVTYAEINTYDDVRRLRSRGATDAAVAEARAAEAATYAYVRGGGDALALQRLLDDAWRKPWARYTTLPHVVPSSRERATWLQWRDLDADPVTWWKRVRVPVLAAFGSDDDVVPVARSARRIGAALRAGGNRDVTVRIYAGAGHGVESDRFPPSVVPWVTRVTRAPARFRRPFRARSASASGARCACVFRGAGSGVRSRM